jgi:hypothetical protein
MAPRRAWQRPRELLGARLCGAVAGFVLCTVASGASADPSPADIKTARQLFSEAEQLRAQGDCAGAVTKLRQAIAIKETPGLRFHLAHCEERLGQLVQANTDYRRASELIRGGMSAPDVQRLLEPAQESLSERVPTVRIRVPELTPPVRVHLDGQELGRDALSNFIPVDPGKHTVLAEAEGYDPFRIELSIAEGDDRVVEAKLRSSGTARVAAGKTAVAPGQAPAALVSATAAPVDPKHDGSGFGAREAVVLGETALALVGVGVGVTFWFKYQAANDEVNGYYDIIDAAPGGCGQNAGPSMSVPCAELEAALLDRAKAGNVALAGFIGAGAFGAAAVATWLLWPTRTPKDAAVLVVPFPGGAAVSGAF